MSDNILDEYYVKPIEWNGEQAHIITQNKNGPCPLVAICNVLFLRGDLKLPDRPVVTFEYLVERLGDYLLTLTNEQVPLEDMLNVLPKLKNGLDVNILFDTIHGFESTPELSLFELFHVDLVHGWIVDPQDTATFDVIVKNCKNYNQTVNSIVQANEINTNQPTTEEEEKLHQAFIASEFLKDTATQLTYYGLELLVAAIPQNKLCVLFRNNHFSTVYKHPEFGLMMLVTDSGFIKERSVTWESLGDVDQGSAEFFNDSFRPHSTQTANQQDIDLDHAIAASLQETSQPVQAPVQTPVQVRVQEPVQTPKKRKSQCIIS